MRVVRAFPLSVVGRFAILVAGALVFTIFRVGSTVQDVSAQACDPALQNEIVCENLLPGAPPSEWEVSGAGDASIQGFATDISVNRGSTVRFKIDTNASAYVIDIYRLGYYGGMGARKVATIAPSAALPQNQPNCLSNANTGLVDCGNWALSGSWNVPANAVSGLYIARPVRTDTGGASHIPFVVRDDTGGSELLFQTSDTTWQAYNQYGGNSLYVGGSGIAPDRAVKVSYNRPFTTRAYAPEDWIFNAEYPMIRWLEANGYDVSYFTGIDADRFGAEILEHTVFVSIGHDEYWSGAQRANVEAARAASPPVHLAFFSGNEIFWKVRWESSIDASATPYRTLVSYKETHANAKIDPAVDPITGVPVWTGTWRDPRFSPPADGGRPENALTGTIFKVNSGTDAIGVPAELGKHRFWRNTTVATMPAGTAATLPDGTLGYEWDEAPNNGVQPPGLMRLSRRTVAGVETLLDYGNTSGTGTATHSLTLYRHESGALVFGAGTVQWSWGLDSNHDRGSDAPDTRMRQATVNLFADMGVLPRTIQSGLVLTAASSDTLAPASTLISPASGASIAQNTTVTISGTATDNGGGIVSAVEVSTDGGATWRPAAGTSNWTYEWLANGAGTFTIQSRAWDDTGNRETPLSGVTVEVGSGATTECPCSIWDPSAVPALMENDSQAIEIGTKFRAAVDGLITGIRFYKYAENVGPHVGNLWTAAGAKLGSVTFTDETAAGWQQQNFATPIPITANTTYVVSYHTPSGFYGMNAPYFTSDVNNPPLRALADGEDGANGVYRYGATSGFPNETWNASNYWVDVVFMDTAEADTTAPTVTATSPASGESNVAVNVNVTATFSEGMNAATINGTTFELRDATNIVVPATVTYDAAARRATLDPASPLLASRTYTARVRGGAVDPRVKDQAGNAPVQDVIWSFTTAAVASDNCPCTIWLPSAVPAMQEPDFNAVEVGVKFRSSVAGYITGLRFYKYASNTGTHVGNLWTSTGTRMATATFGNETVSGWQQVSFDAPVPIAANTTYIASYHTNVGGYGVTYDYFVNSVTRGPLTALRDGLDGGNGLYRYNQTSTAAPNESFQAQNYWVDVVFVSNLADTAPPTVTGTDPLANRSGVSVAGTISATFSEPLSPSTVSTNTVTLQTLAGAAISASVSYNDATRTATLTPAAPLAFSTRYRATLKGGTIEPRIKDVAGNAMAADYTWTFTTAAAPAPPPDQGPGGPILVVAGSANAFGKYFAEILRTEGLNAFSVANLSTVSAATLSNFDVVILGETALTTAQVTMLTEWVNGGGNLIAMRPDRKLASLLGLVNVSGSISNAYLRIDTGTAAGAGLVNETIQFHGTADRYTLGDATPLAMLYSNATTVTAHPAVTVRSVGINGGQAAAFTFDLARSVVYTRQGNPAWAGQERDGIPPIRSDDLFFGARAGDVQPDWINLAKVAIPQADEQQRLLAQLILHVNGDRKPLPRFWYLPRMAKAAVVMTGDDHGNNGTAGRFEQFRALSEPGCSVDDWECVRGTSYIYPNTPMTDAAAAAYEAEGFEIALHPDTTCANYTQASLEQTLATQLTTMAMNFPSLASPVTNRTHCLVWSDWFSQVTVQAMNGIRFDHNYYYYPASWITNRPGMFTGSGWPMRFANVDGEMADVYQAATQMTDESGQVYPFTIDALLDRALGPEGYYGAFSTNLHTDFASHGDGDAVLASALARGVPIISARQMLQWLDARNGSSFRDIAFDASVLTFSIDVAARANGLRALLPTTTPSGTLTGLQRNGAVIPYTVETIKGIEYAVFAAEAGAYAAAYGIDGTPPVITGIASVPATDGTAAISWTTSEPADSRGEYGTSADALTLVAGHSDAVTAHTVTLSGLAPNTTYFYRVRSADSVGNAALAPAALDAPLSFVTPLPLLSIAATTGAEGTGSGGTLQFVVTLSSGSPDTVTVEYGTIDGTAVRGADYVEQAGTLTFAPGVTTRTVVVPLAGDALDELNETVLVVLSSPHNATIVTPQATGTIDDDDAAPALAIGDVSVVEGNAGIANATFTVTLSAPSGLPVSVGYATANATATAPGDYTTTSGTLSFTPGSTTRTLTVAVTGDATNEGDETFQVVLTSPSNAALGRAQSVGTIVNDDPLPSISVADVSLTEGNTGTATATFVLTLSAASGRVVTVGYATASGSADAGSDFTTATGTASFAVGSTTTSISVAVIGDSLLEADETFLMNLSAPSNATVARAQATATIHNDDGLPVLSVADASTVEGNSGTKNLSFTVTLSAASITPVSVSYATGAGTATAGTDYVAASGTLTIPAGSIAGTITVVVNGDTTSEPNETFTLTLSNPVNATLARAAATGTVSNDDGSSGLVAAFSFDQGEGTTLFDSSGNGLNGAIAGAAWAAGRNGGALAFDGVDDWVTVNDHALLDVTRLTVSAWVKPTVRTPWMTVVMKETPDGLAYALYANNDVSRPAGEILVNGVIRVAQGTAAVATTAWTHLAYTFDGANMRMYVNGVLVRTVARAGNIAVSTGPLRIGGNGPWGEHFNGLIDDVRVYNRALTLAEVQADMNTPVQ
jgi:hypothetical protein